MIYPSSVSFSAPVCGAPVGASDAAARTGTTTEHSLSLRAMHGFSTAAPHSDATQVQLQVCFGAEYALL